VPEIHDLDRNQEMDVVRLFPDAADKDIEIARKSLNDPFEQFISGKSGAGQVL
jgi:hypothetical protein